MPYDTPGAYVYGTGSAVDPAGLVDDIWSQAQACGFPLEAINSEFDWPQFEFTLRYRDSLGAIDDIFLFRLMAREVAAKRGYLLSFMPKPLTDRGGSGVHLNLSLAMRAGTTPSPIPRGRTASPSLPGTASRGSCTTTAPWRLIAPTVNSYRRLRPASLAGYWANWGYDHRGVAVRVPGERGPGDLASSIVSPTAPPIPTSPPRPCCRRRGSGWRTAIRCRRRRPGTGWRASTPTWPCPRTWARRLDALERDEALVSAIGALLVANHIGIKRKEWDDYLGSTTDWEMSRYLNFL